MTVAAKRSSFAASPLAVAAVVLAGALAGWVVTTARMGGMDMGPGADLGALPWFLGLWVTMMAAMMLPSVLPMVLLFSRVSTERARRARAFVPTWIFVAGYLLAWAAFGIGAFVLYRGVAALDLAFLAWDRQGPLVAGTAVVAAGLYELTPLKSVCLRHCRSPMHFVVGGWREGRAGAVRMGVEHGVYCVGCCWGLMIVLFALGVMSVAWMAIVAGVIFAQKVLPFGARLVPYVSVAVVGLGVWIGVDAESVPLLVEPAPRMTEMPMRP